MQQPLATFNDDATDRHCCVCGSQDRTLVLDQAVVDVVGIGASGYRDLINVCNKCGFFYTAPLLPESVILHYYEAMSNYEHAETNGVRAIEDVRQIKRQVELIEKQFPQSFKGNALDIGCSIAYGLSLLKKKGWNVLGLDPSDKCIEISKQDLGVEVIKGFFSPKVQFKNSPFDLIILSHVVEHLIYPEEVLRGIRNVLSDEGLVYIEVPNTLKPNGTKSYFGFEHINYFTPTSLTNLLQQNGFEVASIHTFDNGRHIHPFYPVIALLMKKSDKNFKIVNDKDELLEVVKSYRIESNKIVESFNSKIQSILLNLTTKGRLALWGAGLHTSQLLADTILKPSDIHCIYDNNPKKSGSTLMGVPVKSFPESIEEAKSSIDAILISSEASENAIYSQLSYLQAVDIQIYKLYDSD